MAAQGVLPGNSGAWCGPKAECGRLCSPQSATWEPLINQRFQSWHLRWALGPERFRYRWSREHILETQHQQCQHLDSEELDQLESNRLQLTAACNTVSTGCYNIHDFFHERDGSSAPRDLRRFTRYWNPSVWLPAVCCVPAPLHLLYILLFWNEELFYLMEV